MKYAFFVWKVSWYLCEQDLLKGEDRCGWISPQGQEELSPNKTDTAGLRLQGQIITPLQCRENKD